MPDSCDDLIYDNLERMLDEFCERLEEIEEEIERAEQAGVKFTSSIRNDLNRAKSHSEKAREILNANGRGKLEETLKKEFEDHLQEVLDEILNLKLVVPYQRVRHALKSFEGYEDLATVHIKDYSKHIDELGEIEKIVADYGSPDKREAENRSNLFRGQLLEFLRDYEAGRGALSAAIRKEKQADQLQKTHVRLSRTAVVATVVSCLVAVISLIASFILAIVNVISSGHSNNVVEIFWMP